MASFTEVMRQARRMCKIESKKLGCNGCPRKRKSCIPKTNATFDLGDDEEYERDVMQWAKEHPEPRYQTWKEWWENNFPDAVSCISPCCFMSENEWCSVSKIPCKDCTVCRNAPIPAHIAEKLGIQPIGGIQDEGRIT